MAYSRSWQESSPTDSDLRAQVDDFIRNLKVDMRERLNEIFINWSADPVVPQAAILGNVGEKRLHLHGCSFREVGNLSFPKTIIGGEGGLVYQGSPTGLQAYATLDLPPGVTVTQLGLNMSNPNSETLRLDLCRTSWASGTLSVVSTFSTLDNGPFAVSGAISHLISADYSYTLLLTMLPNSTTTTIRAARVLYSTPDCRSTK